MNIGNEKENKEAYKNITHEKLNIDISNQLVRLIVLSLDTVK